MHKAGATGCRRIILATHHTPDVAQLGNTVAAGQAQLTGVTACAASPSSSTPGPSRREHLMRLPAAASKRHITSTPCSHSKGLPAQSMQVAVHEVLSSACRRCTNIWWIQGPRKQGRIATTLQAEPLPSMGSWQQHSAHECSGLQERALTAGHSSCRSALPSALGPPHPPAGLGCSLSTCSAMSGIQCSGTPVNFAFSSASTWSLLVRVACSPVFRLIVPLR